MNSKRTSMRKLKKCVEEKKKTDLIYYPDFWEFYEVNRRDFDYIFFRAAKNFLNVIPKHDLYMEVLTYLHDNDILRKWDSRRASLKTYLTRVIINCVGKIAEKEQNRHYWKPPSSKCKKVISAKSVSYNFGLESLVNDPEEQIEIDDILKYFWKKLPKNLAIILLFLSKGYNREEVAHIFGCSSGYICNKNRDIKKHLQDLLGYTIQRKTEHV